MGGYPFVYFTEGNKGNQGGLWSQFDQSLSTRARLRKDQTTFGMLRLTRSTRLMLACFELVEKLRAGSSLVTYHFGEVPEFLRITDNINAGDLAAADTKGKH